MKLTSCQFHPGSFVSQNFHTVQLKKKCALHGFPGDCHFHLFDLIDILSISSRKFCFTKLPHCAAKKNMRPPWLSRGLPFFYNLWQYQPSPCGIRADSLIPSGLQFSGSLIFIRWMFSFIAFFLASMSMFFKVISILVRS